MSQLLSEAMHGIERAVEKAAAHAVEAAQAAQEAQRNATHVAQRNQTQSAQAVKPQGTFGQTKMWFLPALQSVLNTSRVKRPAEVASQSPPPPWAPASLFLNWPGVRQLLGPRLPVFASNATSTNWSTGIQSNHSSNSTLLPRLRCGRCNGTHALAHAHLQRARRRLPRPPLPQRRLLSTVPWQEKHGRQFTGRRSLQPNVTAGLEELWKSPHFLNSPRLPQLMHLNNTRGNSTQPTWICASGFAQTLEATTALGCADALALALSTTALVSCFTTLLCVWLLLRYRQKGTPAEPLDLTSDKRPPDLITSSIVDFDPPPLDSSPDSTSPLASPIKRLMHFVPRSDRKFSALC